jgi:hypothetical protein
MPNHVHLLLLRWNPNMVDGKILGEFDNVNKGLKLDFPSPSSILFQLFSI